MNLQTSLRVWHLTELRHRWKHMMLWLVSAGAAIETPSNEWEILRFRFEGSTGLVWKNSKNDLVKVNALAEAMLVAYFNRAAFGAAEASNVQPIRPKVAKTMTELVKFREENPLFSNTKLRLLDRDGPLCFLCLCELGDDATIEHLLAKAHKGNDGIANKALAHQKCNVILADKPVMEKIRMREKNLIEKEFHER